MAPPQQRKRQLRGYLQDTRGFVPFVHAIYACLVVGFVVLILTSYRTTGISFILFGSICWYIISNICQPPYNNPWKFLLQYPPSRGELVPEDRRRRKAPVLVCLGDSLTHGQVSANWVGQIVSRIAQRIDFPGTLSPVAAFQYPIYVINAGQNSLVSRVAVQERIQPVVDCQPNYVVVMIGTNDVIGMYSGLYKQYLKSSWMLPNEEPSWECLERNWTNLLTQLQKARDVENKRRYKIAIGTLPPLGEDLTHPSNEFIRKANTILHRLVDNINKTIDNKKQNITVLPVYERMEEIILQRRQVDSFQQAKSTIWKRPSVDYIFLYSALIPSLHFLSGMTWKRLGDFLGYELFSDTVHLNERGGEIITDLVVEWLFEEKVEKAIQEATTSN